MVNEDDVEEELRRHVHRLARRVRRRGLATSIQMIRRLRNEVEKMLYNMSFAMVDIFKIAPMVSAMTTTAITVAKSVPVYGDAINKLLQKGVTITLLPISEDLIKPFPREITLSGDLDTAYQRCFDVGEDEVERMLRQIYCGYALLNLMSLVTVVKTPEAVTTAEAT